MTPPDSFTISGGECVVALGSLGFMVVQRQPGRTVLRRGRHVVIVPDLLELPVSAIDAILREADVGYLTLIHALDELPTEPELAVLDA